MKLNASVMANLRKVSSGLWVNRDDGQSLCDLKLVQRGPVHGFVLTKAGMDALKSAEK
jgi:hypothetical protein